MLLDEVGGSLTVEIVQAANPTWDDEDVFRIVRASAGVSPHVVRRVVSDTMPWDLVNYAATWPDTVTILAADPAVGALFTPHDAARLTHLRPDVRILTVAQAGHSVHRDAPATVLAAIDGLVAHP